MAHSSGEMGCWIHRTNEKYSWNGWALRILGSWSFYPRFVILSIETTNGLLILDDQLLLLETFGKNKIGLHKRSIAMKSVVARFLDCSDSGSRSSVTLCTDAFPKIYGWCCTLAHVWFLRHMTKSSYIAWEWPSGQMSLVVCQREMFLMNIKIGSNRLCLKSLSGVVRILACVQAQV